MSRADAIAIGDEIAKATFGPLTIVDTVRWAGVQENVEQIHWDREFVRETSRLPTFIASGTYRQALLARVLTDWLGPDGRLQKLRLRHLAPTFEGDTQIYSAKVAHLSTDGDEDVIACDLEGRNQKGDLMLTGQCQLRLRRTAG